ncbi:ATP-dependent Zn protease [Phormidesmis priestleyi]
MNQTALNLIAISIFAMTVSTILGPLVNLPPALPAIATFTVLGLATLDSFTWQGRGGTIVLGWLASFSPAHRARVARHEAGHFLVAQQLGIPVTGYTLSAWEAFRAGQSGQGGVQFDTQELEEQLQQKKLSVQLVDRYCTVWMAGGVAETLAYKTVEGGNDDLQKLRTTLAQLRLPDSQIQQKERWAALQAKNLIEQNQAVYDALVAAMEERRSVEDCRQLISAKIEE